MGAEEAWKHSFIQQASWKNRTDQAQERGGPDLSEAHNLGEEKTRQQVLHEGMVGIKRRGKGQKEL
jgi:hypothetical protein